MKPKQEIINPHNIVLIGFMGSGKSTIGRALHKISSFSFLDSDAIIESQQMLSIGDIFRNFGEKHFRELEIGFCQWIKSHVTHSVISTGGGLPLVFDTREIGVVFFLDLDFHVILNRLSLEERNKRPLLSNIQKAKELYISRKTSYKQQAHFILNGALPTHLITQEMLHAMANVKI